MLLAKLKQILRELKVHLPFTLIGAASGIVLMLIGHFFLRGYERTMFAVFHPLHVVFSAMVTAALFEMHRKVKNFLIILLVGVVGAIGIATLSDSILPFFGESILGAAIPTHADLHENAHADESPVQAETAGHEHAAAEEPAHTEALTDEHAHEEAPMQAHDDEDQAAADLHDHEAQPGADAHDTAAVHEDPHEHDLHRPGLHLGFIEEWYLVFPAAILGVVLAYFRPATKVPHAGHVLLSTWASSAHILMNTQAEMSLLLLTGLFIVLFLSVWLPCCVSDIVFPLLFVRSDGAHVGHSCLLCGRKEPKHTS